MGQGSLEIGLPTISQLEQLVLCLSQRCNTANSTLIENPTSYECLGLTKQAFGWRPNAVLISLGGMHDPLVLRLGSARSS
jgi:hypothetical protein